MKYNAIIEIPYRSKIKYEIDKGRNMLYVDRILHTSMIYPGNYGYIENTLALDGDPLDVLVLSEYEFAPMSFVAVKPIGVVLMEDEKGMDEKIIAVVDEKVDKNSEMINEIKDLPHRIQEINHFFEHYKDLETGKYVNVSGYDGAAAAIDIINKYTIK